MAQVSDVMQDRIQGFGEAILGTAVATVPFLGKVFDSVMAGAHTVALLGGAFVAMHGIYRIFRKRTKRRSDVDNEDWRRE